MRTRTLIVALLVALLVASSACVVSVAGAAPPHADAATVHPKIGPHQLFVGTINGSTGAPAPAVVKVVCPGPTGPGRTGHPLGHQFVAVQPATSTAASTGDTGDGGTSVSVFFGAPPPSTGAAGTLTFVRYGVEKPIPTSLSVPCSGTGTVYFVPFPRDPPTSRSAAVAVVYADISLGTSR